MKTTLGIDLGTSELKLALIDEAGALVASAGAPLSVSRPHPHWAEQDPHDWWNALVAAAQRAARAGRHRVGGRAGDRAVGPDAWRRAGGRGAPGAAPGHPVERHAQRRAMRRAGAPPAVAAATSPATWRCPASRRPSCCGWPSTSRICPAASDKVLLPKDWLRWRLTATAVSEMSDAAGTLWLDVARRDWSPELLQAGGMTLAQMPSLVEGSAVSGHLQRDAALALGLPEGLPVAGGGGDNAASAVGIGATQPGEGFLSLGTSGVLFVVTDRHRPNPASAVHAFCHALPGRWHQMSVMLSAANGLQWVTRLTGAASEAALLERVEALADAAARPRAAVPALPVRRAHAAQRRRRQRRVLRHGQRDRRRPPGPRGDRGRRLRPGRRPAGLARRRHRGGPAHAGGRRRAQRALGAAAGRHARHRAADRGRRRGRRRDGRRAASRGWRSATTSATSAGRPRRAPSSSRARTGAPRCWHASSASARSIDARATCCRAADFLPSRRPDMTDYFAGIDKIRYAGPQSTEAARLQVVRQGSPRAGQAHGGAPALRRLLLAHLLLERLRPVRLRRHVRAPVAARRRPDGGRQGQARRRVRVLRQAGRAVLLLPRPRRRPRGRDAARERRQLPPHRRPAWARSRPPPASSCCGAPPTCSAIAAS